MTERSSRLKYVTSVVILVAAIAAAGYSIFRKSEGGVNQTGLMPALAADSSTGGNCAAGLAAKASPETMAFLTMVVGDRDAAFVILPDPDDTVALTRSAEVEAVVLQLTAQGKQVTSMTFDPRSPGYRDLVKLGGLNSFPSVAVLGGGCGLAMLEGTDITELALIRAFVVATTVPPGCSSICAPAGGK